MGIKEDIAKVEKKINTIEHESFAMEMLKDQRKQNKRMFIILLVVLCMWFATIGYLVYILNDIGTIEETTEVTQDNENGYNNYIGNDGDINYGKTEN